MPQVREILDASPVEEPIITLVRDEALLLTRAAIGGRSPEPPTLIEAISFSPTYVAKPFSPPTFVYENEQTRVELQDMNGRQPFYHRNLTVDEMSYQVTGPRQLITELGSVDLEPGDFVRIPVGVAHDNFGRREIHLLFYVQDRVEEQLPVGRRSEPHVFKDWQPTTVPEMLGDGTIRVYQQSNEQLLVDQVHVDDRRLDVMRTDSIEPGTTWVWKSRPVWIGMTRLVASQGTEYCRHRFAEEMQYQVAGARTLVTQDGCLELEPGDFVKIPRGCAFTSICERETRYINLLSVTPMRRVAEATRQGELRTAADIDRLRLAAAAARQ